MSIDSKRWFVRLAQSLSIVLFVWVIAWFIGGANFALGVVAVVILMGIIGAFIT